MVTMCSARDGVDAIDHGGQRGRLTGTGDAGDQHQPARHVANLLDHFGQEQLIQGANLGGNHAQDQSDVAALLEDVHTEAAQSGDAVGHIDFRGLFEFLFLPRRHHAEGHVQHVFRGDARLVGQRRQLAVDAQVRIVAHLQMQVRGLAFRRDTKQVINIHAECVPGSPRGFKLSQHDAPNRHLPQDDLGNGPKLATGQGPKFSGMLARKSPTLRRQVEWGHRVLGRYNGATVWL